MKMRTLGCALVVLGLLLTSSAGVWAASSPKIGYFDLQTVIDKSTWGQQVKADFQKQRDQMKAEMDQKAKDFKALKDEYDKKKSVMDDKAKSNKAQELFAKQQEGEKFIMESNAKLNKLSSELTAPVIDKVIDIARKIAKDEKYDYILEVQKGGIVYANEKDDLTKRLTDELNKVTPKK